MLMYDAIMAFYFTRPGQARKDRQGGTVFQQVMGPAAQNQPVLMGMMGPCGVRHKVSRFDYQAFRMQKTAYKGTDLILFSKPKFLSEIRKE